MSFRLQGHHVWRVPEPHGTQFESIEPAMLPGIASQTVHVAQGFTEAPDTVFVVVEVVVGFGVAVGPPAHWHSPEISHGHQACSVPDPQGAQ